MSYQSDYSGAQVEEAVGKAINPDATPTEGSTNLVQSGGVASAVSALKAKLLWTNPSPASAFGAQTIPLDLAPYSMLHIVIKATAGDTGVLDAQIPVDGETHTVIVMTVPPSDFAAVGLARSFKPSSTGVVITAGTVKTFVSGNRDTDNTRIVPYKIYGIL